jgi:hypothetical protein
MNAAPENRVIHIFSRDEWLAEAVRAMPSARVLTLRAEPSSTVSAVPVSPAIARENACG